VTSSGDFRYTDLDDFLGTDDMLAQVYEDAIARRVEENEVVHDTDWN